MTTSVGSNEAGKSALPASFVRERQLIRLLITFLASGLLFMLLPGTFLGVWNLFAISSAQSATSVSPALSQAHGHAQLFGWLGSFILGIGYYAIPNIRRLSLWSFWEGWVVWALWTAGVALRWVTDVYQWYWQVVLPLSATLELAAVIVFLVRTIQGHTVQKQANRAIDPWAVLVIAGSLGLLATMILNAVESYILPGTATSPAFPREIRDGLLVLSVWGFPVLVAWGFTLHWMPVFLGLKKARRRLLYPALACIVLGILSAIDGMLLTSALAIFAGAVVYVAALRIFEGSERPPKVQGVHKSFPVFVRAAYAWLVAAAVLTIWAALDTGSIGIAGAGRHAVTVGFLMTMVLAVAPRVLPAFLGKERLFSERLMFLSLLLVNAGCLIRVSSQVVAYGDHFQWAWSLLPVSASLELAGVVLFSANMAATFCQPPLLRDSTCRRG